MVDEGFKWRLVTPVLGLPQQIADGLDGRGLLRCNFLSLARDLGAQFLLACGGAGVGVRAPEGLTAGIGSVPHETT